MLIYKITDAESWYEALTRGHFLGSADDLRDGFIHFSTAEQTPGTLAKHFAGRGGLIIAAIDSAQFGPALKWDPSRGGAVFPHLYVPLPVDAVAWWKPIPLRLDGVHVLPPEVI